MAGTGDVQLFEQVGNQRGSADVGDHCMSVVHSSGKVTGEMSSAGLVDRSRTTTAMFDPISPASVIGDQTS